MMEAASALFGILPTASTTYNVNIPDTPSLTNLAPFSIGAPSLGEDDSSTESLETEEFHINDLRLEQKFETCTNLWRIARDEAGPWMTHRFTLYEWDCRPKPHPKYQTKKKEKKPEAFDGVLTKEIIIPNLSKLARSPEFGHYAFTKCTLEKMKLTDINAIRSYRYLQYLDVSSNRLTTLIPLGNLPFLKILEASHNSLTSILDFKAPYFLTIANLSYNRIKEMRDLSDFWSITDLNLSHNLIKTIDGIKNLRFLATLNLSSNRIETIENLSDLRVQFLYLQHNIISLTEKDDKAMFHTLKNIRTINLNLNQVSSLKPFEGAVNLECLDIVDNNVARLLDIYYLRNLKYLNKVNLTGNPVKVLRRYVEICVTHIKNLVTLDEEAIDSDYWLEKISTATIDVTQEAAHNRLNLIVLEQLSPPQIQSWLLPYDSPPLAVIVLVGLCASRKAYIARKLCHECQNVVVGVPYSTKPKCTDLEVEDEDDYHYVDDETFMRMLKNSEFLTYQEHLGAYYGIAHDEFRKAKNRILMFHANLTVALSIRRRFLSTVFVLGLPSTERAHKETLCSLYAVKFLDDGAVKILDSPSLAQRCQQEFEQEKLRNHDAREVLNKLVQEVCGITSRQTDDEPTKQSIMTVADTGDTAKLKESEKDEHISIASGVSDVSAKSEFLQLWWSTTPAHSLSLVIHPTNVSSLYIGSDFGLSEQSKANLEVIQHTPQIKRYVSFTVAHVHNIPNSAEASILDGVDRTTKDSKKIVNSGTNQGSNISTQGVIKRSQVSFTNIDESAKLMNDERPRTPTTSSTNLGCEFTDSSSSEAKKQTCAFKSYVDMLLCDIRLKSMFEEELRQRDELLDLHLNMPGLFRELVFTDREDETLKRLRTVVKEVNKYYETTKRSILDFSNDLSCTGLIQFKTEKCFRELKRDVSLFEKQAAEFALKDVLTCAHRVCEQPNCQIWSKV